jgi:hypothetical protein
MKSMDDLPDIGAENRFRFSADLAEILWPEVPEGYEIRFARPPELPVWHAGVLFRWGSLWIGAHYAAKHKRLCVNLIPCVTIWVTAPGGDVP